jgi:hypothetical protein
VDWAFIWSSKNRILLLERGIIFAYQTEEVFNHVFHIADTVEIDMNLDEAYELIKTSEKRFYFNSDTLVDLKKKGEELFGSETVKEAIESIQSSANDNLMIIKTRK